MTKYEEYMDKLVTEYKWDREFLGSLDLTLYEVERILTAEEVLEDSLQANRDFVEFMDEINEDYDSEYLELTDDKAYEEYDRTIYSIREELSDYLGLL